MRKVFGSKGDLLVWRLEHPIMCPKNCLHYSSFFLQEHLCLLLWGTASLFPSPCFKIRIFYFTHCWSCLQEWRSSFLCSILPAHNCFNQIHHKPFTSTWKEGCHCARALCHSGSYRVCCPLFVTSLLQIISHFHLFFAISSIVTHQVCISRCIAFFLPTPYISRQEAGDGANSNLQSLIQGWADFQYGCFVVRH